MGPAHASRGWTDLQDESHPLRHRVCVPPSSVPQYVEVRRRGEPGYDYSVRAGGAGATMRR